MALLLLTAGPAAAKKITIDTSPVKQGRVFLNGDFVGVAPVAVDLKLKKNEFALATAEKEGALGLWQRRIEKDDGGTIMVRLEEDVALHETIDSDIANLWLTITPKLTRDLDDSINENAVWQKIVSVVTDNFSDLEQLDRSSFYLRTAWRVRRYPHSVMRNRLVVKRGVTDELSVRVQLESQAFIANGVNTPISSDLFTETNRIFTDDKETIDFLRDQL